MIHYQAHPVSQAIDVPVIEQLIQTQGDDDGTRRIQVTVKHVHQYQGSGLMEAVLALLTALLFIFGSVTLAIAASKFYQGVQSSRASVARSL